MFTGTSTKAPSPLLWSGTKHLSPSFKDDKKSHFNIVQPSDHRFVVVTIMATETYFTFTFFHSSHPATSLNPIFLHRTLKTTLGEIAVPGPHDVAPHNLSDRLGGSTYNPIAVGDVVLASDLPFQRWVD